MVSTRGSPLLDVVLDGVKVRMLADTGAFQSFLWRETLPTLKRRTGNSIGYAAGIGGVTAMHEITVPKMSVGPTEFRAQYFLVVGAPGGHMGEEAGLFGADFLGQSDVQFDLPGQMIRMVHPVHCKGEEEVFWPGAYSEAPMVSEAGSARYMTTVKINGHALPALIDTGASKSVITPGVAQRLGVTIKSVDGKFYGIGPQALPTGLGRMDSFSLGDETIHNTSIHVADVFKGQSFSETGTRLGEFRESPSMILGADFFRSHKVLLSRSQNRIFFSYVGGPVFDDSAGSARTSTPTPAPGPGA